MLAAGVLEARAHSRALEAIPLRVHVNGTRGKSSVTRAVATLFRKLGKSVVGKCTGTRPVVIQRDGTERLLRRRGRTRVQEQVRFLRYAARQRVDVAVVECMAVDPTLQWVCEHRFVRSHIGVITNVRRDHFEEMGRSLEEIARCLANTIPRQGLLVTSDTRFAPLFEEVAASLGTRVVLVDGDEVHRWAAILRGDRTDGAVDASRSSVETVLNDTLLELHAENVAIACTVATSAGYSEAAVAEAARAMPRPRLNVTTLDAFDSAGRVLVHAWSMNDTDSFRRFYTVVADHVNQSAPTRGRAIVPLYNHRSDRPLRALEFGRLFASDAGMARVLVTGDPGGARLLRRAGVAPERIQTIRFPITIHSVAAAVRDITGPIIVFGCGNARGVEGFELGEPVPTAAHRSVGVRL